jgi:hypothetical protein
MLLIFLPETSARHQYVFSHIFGYLGIEFSITNSKEEFAASPLPKLSYGPFPIDGDLHIFDCGLLNKTNIAQINHDIGSYKGVTVLFRHSMLTAALPYDIFSAVFFMLSRYEEYLPFVPDEHGRFEASNSLAFQHKFLYTPVVDLWIGQLGEVLLERFPELKIKKRDYDFIPTYDIDIAYSFRHKGFLRNVGGFLRDGLHWNCNDYFSRILVLPGLRPDPFDSYDYQFALQDKYQLKPLYFFHPGTYGRFDKNVAPEKKHIRQLLGRIAEKATLGVHPSYLSTENPELLAKEIKRLEAAAGKKITIARQHFIKIRFPDTYRNYAANGITDDYSMGFATDIGFRAGTSEPFLFFDLPENKTIDLTIHPFVFMEGVFKFYKNHPESDIIPNIAELTQQIKQTKGTFISLWHNESLGTSKQWKGWRTIYELMIELVKK